MREYTLFFSWQTEAKKTKGIITTALKQAIANLKLRGIEITLDQDTRNRVGIRKIDDEVISKIKNCDIFVCDLSPVITKEPEDKDGLKRHMPNSNVLFEFGYALGVLGQDYIITLAKFDKGEHIELMPFDIKTFTISTFNAGKDLKDVDIWLENICNKVDAKRAGQTPDYDLILGISNGNEVTLSGEIHPTYKRTINRHKVSPITTTPSPKNNKATSVFTSGTMDSLFRQTEASTMTPKVIPHIILKEIYRSYDIIKIVIWNKGKKALENVAVNITSDNDEVRFKRTNEKDIHGFSEILTSGGIFVQDKKVSKHYDTLNPEAIYSLETFYVYVPYGVDTINLRWNASAKTGRFDGQMEIKVIPEYHDEEISCKARPDGEVTYSQYVENITDADLPKQSKFPFINKK